MCCVTTKVNGRGADRDSHEDDDEDESAQQKLIGWIQERHRECAILISLGCVVTTFIHYVRNVPLTTSIAVALVPVAVNLLLTWDIYVKWDKRFAKYHTALYTCYFCIVPKIFPRTRFQHLY